jgi:hypothetical protein
MELPEEIFQELTATADVSLGRFQGGGEHRASDRAWVGRRAAITVIASGRVTRRAGVFVREMSRASVGIVHTARLARGATFVLSITKAGAEQRRGDDGAASDDAISPFDWVHVECAVVRCECGAGGASSYAIGAQFVRLVDPLRADPQAVEAARRAQRAADRPAHSRAAGPRVTVGSVVIPQKPAPPPPPSPITTRLHTPAAGPPVEPAKDDQVTPEIERIRRAMLG